MPIDYKKYPKDWSEIRFKILERENHCCKQCGVKNYSFGWRAENGDFYDWEYIHNALEDHGHDLFNDILKNCHDKEGNPTKGVKIILTVAHLDHDITNNDFSNLAALCQRCHLLWDKEHHMKNSRETIRKKKGLQTLF